MIAAVDHDDDQTVDYEEFELKTMERTPDVPQTSAVQQPVPMPQVTTKDVPVPQVMIQEVSKQVPVPVTKPVDVPVPTPVVKPWRESWRCSATDHGMPSSRSFGDDAGCRARGGLSHYVRG